MRRTSSPAARFASVISRSRSRRPSGSTAGAFASRSKLAISSRRFFSTLSISSLKRANERWIYSMVRSSAIIPFTAFTRRMTCAG